MRTSSLALLLGFLTLFVTDAAAQALTTRRYLVYLKDKAGTPFSVTQPRAFLSERAVQRRARQNIAVLPRDLPVSPTYVTQVKAVPGVTLWYTSRWFNAVIVECSAPALAQVQALPFVKATTDLNRAALVKPPVPGPDAPAGPTTAGRTLRDPAYGKAFWQADMLGAVTMHQAGFRGEGMQIAVFDAGFPGVNTASQFASLRSEGRILSTFDFVDRDRTVYEKNNHGTNTLSCMAGNETNVYIGTAPKASYHLCITEDVASEHPVEEANWLIAAEYADSVGVDVISSSLGYTTFDSPSTNYSYTTMNGRTAISSRAATMAARVGILVVNSAGNDGANSWKYIGAPADADSVMTVGAVDSLQSRVGFSSIGPTSDNRIKPNVAAQGYFSAIVTPGGTVVRGNGTSFACPILAGMATGFWQANPTLTAQQVLYWLQQSGTQAQKPDNLLGYGIPSYVTATELLRAAVPKPPDDLQLYPNPTSKSLSLLLPADLLGQPLHVRIHDMRGSLISEQILPASNSGPVPLPIPALRAGVYVCSVEPQGGGSTRSVRFVQQ